MLNDFSKNKYDNLAAYTSDFDKQMNRELVRETTVQSIYLFDLE